MSKTTQVLFAGFGGQGILFTGKFLAYSGLLMGKEISWLPSYGPEMRGGTASCSVIIGDEPIGSPIITNPDILIAMNLPSLDRYEDATVSGGIIVSDSTLIERKVKRADVTDIYIPATKLASDNGLNGLANMIIFGRLLREVKLIPDDIMPQAMAKCVSARHQNLLDMNIKAIELGYNYAE